MEYYTYIYYDPSRNNEPIYVGKGKKLRAWRHLNLKGKSPFISRLKHMNNNGINPIIGIYAGYEEEFSHFLEEELIALFGRKDLGLGPLLNLTDGGEGTSGRTGHKAWNSGKSMSEETKKKISIATKGLIKTPITAEHRKALSDSKIGIKFTDEHKANLKIARNNRKKK